MTKIKICGLFREADLPAVNEALPDFVGLVFAPSRRRIDPDLAGRIRAGLSRDIIPVGVFVNASIAEIAALYQAGIIAIAQLHGHEDRALIRDLKKACGVPVIKAVSVETAADLVPWQGSPLPEGPDYLLFDQGTGGTGKAFDWGLLEPFRGFGGFCAPCFLAGGIDRATIEAALALKPFGIDVSSGAETSGFKDREKILALVTQTRKGAIHNG
ncbi:MAG: phosphoribosylanthranilate isomerase [Treponema sp.]|jgi:phosphoribosylanthranilate isomerase|nr:phosphoribosylanthranilate isomerase [Treponema sp.]